MSDSKTGAWLGAAAPGGTVAQPGVFRSGGAARVVWSGGFLQGDLLDRSLRNGKPGHDLLLVVAGVAAVVIRADESRDAH